MAWRKDKNLTQEQLAQKVGCPRPYLSRLERDEVDPSLSLVRRLAVALREARLEDRPWLVGGVIPRQDRETVRELGFTGVFPTGSSFAEIAEFIQERTPHER